MAELLFGVETEYAVAGMSPSGPIDSGLILHHLVDCARRSLVHLPDLQSHASTFLQNGSKFYVDCGAHPEFCTPECSNPWDVVRYTLAGHTILAGLLSEVQSSLMPEAEIMCFRCNVDYSGAQTTWGCHESYLHRASSETLQPQIIPHLVSRLIYTGAGGFNPLSPGLEFTLSPRAAHLQHVVSANSTSERGIWHTKSESLSSGYSRLHVICGESLCSETAAFLRNGATALVVAMADAGLAPGKAVQLANPLDAMRAVAGDVTCKKGLQLVDGSYLTALAIQRHYLDQAESHLGTLFMPQWGAEVCRHWRAVLDQLDDAPDSIAHSLDWAIKLALYRDQARCMGIRWDALTFWNKVISKLTTALGDGGYGEEGEMAQSLELAIGPQSQIPREIASLDPLLESRGFGRRDLKTLLSGRQKLFEIDTRFGQLGPKGIFQTLDRAGVLKHHIRGVDNIDQAVTEPPATGRARVRGNVIQRMAGSANLECGWQHIVNRQEKEILDLSDPFTSEETWSKAAPGDGRLWQTETGLFLFDEDTHGRDCHVRRQAAVDCILTGDFAGAETLIRGLLSEGFMLSSSFCHLARVLLMTDREAEARHQIAQSWANRDQASAYVIPRILFFQCIFAMFDGAPITPIVGKIKGALNGPGAHLDWTILPMLNHLRSRLGETNFEFLEALAGALCLSTGMPRLNDFQQWREAAATPA
jgi:hypothetical protein